MVTLSALRGMHPGQSASVLDQVLPAIAAGRIVVLSETTPEAPFVGAACSG